MDIWIRFNGGAAERAPLTEVGEFPTFKRSSKESKKAALERWEREKAQIARDQHAWVKQVVAASFDAALDADATEDTRRVIEDFIRTGLLRLRRQPSIRVIAIDAGKRMVYEATVTYTLGTIPATLNVCNASPSEYEQLR